jgi:hypothetical protein
MLPTNSPFQVIARFVFSGDFIPGHVCVETLPIMRVFGRECRHPDRLRITSKSSAALTVEGRAGNWA